jgi:hypothetical protein
MALSAERYSFTFETRGIARSVNLCQFNDGFDGRESTIIYHWLVGVATAYATAVRSDVPDAILGLRGLVLGDSRLEGSGAEMVGHSKLAEVSFEVKFLGEQVIKQLLKDVGWAVG